MIGKFAFWPDLASSFAWKVDAIYVFILLVTIVVSLGVYAAIVAFVVKYKRRSEDEIPEQIEGNLPLEILWSIIPLGIVLVMFAWGIALFYELTTSPAEALNFSVVGKQWMWKVQHPSGKREINELHVPLGQPVRLTMTSEDVIHSFFIPAFRTKMDVVPGRYSTVWFEPTKIGEYHIFCTQYCGTNHSQMIGRVVVMDLPQYEQWLKNGGASSVNTGETPEVAGARLFQEQRCVTCHQTNGIMAPVLQGVFGNEVKLQGGQTIVADEAYIRESILNPTAKVVAGYQPNMPTFQGQVTEDAIIQLIAYIKSLGGAPSEKTAAVNPAEEKPTAPTPMVDHEAHATEEPPPAAKPTDEGQSNAGDSAPVSPQTQPPADGTSSPNEEQTM